MYRTKRFWLTMGACLGLAVIAVAQLGDLIKVGGIALAVDKFGPEMNKAVNKLSGFKESQTVLTKVVPILSVGKGGHIGAAQVMGPPALVQKVRAVAQIEGDFAGRAVRLKALIPIESKDVSNIKRVVGVGISAVLDIKI